MGVSDTAPPATAGPATRSNRRISPGNQPAFAPRLALQGRRLGLQKQKNLIRSSQSSPKTFLPQTKAAPAQDKATVPLFWVLLFEYKIHMMRHRRREPAGRVLHRCTVRFANLFPSRPASRVGPSLNLLPLDSPRSFAVQYSQPRSCASLAANAKGGEHNSSGSLQHRQCR